MPAAAVESDGGSDLKNMDKEEVDRISNLPEHIIHQIMAFLPTTDVTRISVLSKTFRSVWSSFPIIDFDYMLFNKTLDTPEKRMELAYRMDYHIQRRVMDLFWNYVSHSIQRRKLKTIIKKFRLVAFNLDHRTDEAIKFAMENGVKELEIDLGLSEHLLVKIALAKSIDINNLILRCPMIEKLSLIYYKGYKGLRHVKVSSSRITTINLQHCHGINSIEIKSPSLQSFKYIRHPQSESEPCDIKVVTWEFLKILSLEGATITDNWVENYVYELRWLENLGLSRCKMLKRVKVSNTNLKKIELRCCTGLESIEIGVTNLQSFAYEGTSELRKINIDACKHLESLSLKGFNITDEWLKNHVSKLLRLENLTLEQCHTLESVEIFHEHLKGLHLLNCKKVVEVKVDTPELLSFMYSGNAFPFHLFNSTALLDATLSINPSSGTDGDFVMLRDFLGCFDHCKSLTLVCRFSELQYLIFPENLRENLLPPLYDLKHLKVELTSNLKSYTELVDNLLWLSPRLETLYFVSDIKDKSIKLQYGRMAANEENPFCCQGQLIKCWRHYLRIVEMENFEDVDDKDNLLKYFKKNAKLIQTINFY